MSKNMCKYFVENMLWFSYLKFVFIQNDQDPNIKTKINAPDEYETQVKADVHAFFIS